MNQGARVAQGNVLLFLHADTRLPASALRDIRAVMADPRYVGDPNVRSQMVVPLVSAGRAIGVLVLASRSVAAFSQRQ